MTKEQAKARILNLLDLKDEADRKYLLTSGRDSQVATTGQEYLRDIVALCKAHNITPDEIDELIVNS